MKLTPLSLSQKNFKYCLRFFVFKPNLVDYLNITKWSDSETGGWEHFYRGIRRDGKGLMGNTVELQWLEHLWNHENKFETWIIRAKEC